LANLTSHSTMDFERRMRRARTSRVGGSILYRLDFLKKYLKTKRIEI
jgi:hypothetical protein